MQRLHIKTMKSGFNHDRENGTQSTVSFIFLPGSVLHNENGSFMYFSKLPINLERIIPYIIGLYCTDGG